MSDLKIASRRSALALAQARWVAAELEGHNPGIEIEIVEVVTSGDRDRTSPVAALTEVGAFVRAVQTAVLNGEADLAVHSCKDLPVAGPPSLVSVYPQREAPWDVLCGATLDELPAGARIGTGSPRREAQLRLLRPDLRIEGIRGNVGTRLGLVERGDMDAVVLAEAGLRRLGREEEIAHRFTLDEMVPAPAQAALSVETREGSPAHHLSLVLDHQLTREAVEAERLLLAETGAGCRSALGALAEIGATIRLAGFVEDERGARKARVEARSGEAAVSALVAGLAL